ncbi:MAG: hypothetical protein AAGK77_06930, partial [Pseudomonadota bacterium]
SALPLSYSSAVRGEIDPIAPPCKPILDANCPLRYRSGMAEKPQPKPKVQSDRDARLKQALKANMAKRKAQARARAEAGKKQEQDNG